MQWVVISWLCGWLLTVLLYGAFQRYQSNLYRDAMRIRWMYAWVDGIIWPLHLSLIVLSYFAIRMALKRERMESARRDPI